MPGEFNESSPAAPETSGQDAGPPGAANETPGGPAIPWVPDAEPAPEPGEPAAEGRQAGGWDSGGGDGDARLDAIEHRLDAITETLTEFHRRSAHREAVIDRLHEERTEQRAGIRRALLDPVVTDLIRLHDGLDTESRRLSGLGNERGADLLAGFADDGD